MFKFDFNLDDPDGDLLDSNSTRISVNEKGSSQQTRKEPPLVTYQVQDLTKTLPPLISYSPLRMPLANGQSLTLLRRDLYDARFQLISETSTEELSSDLDFIDAPSDLVPGVYEGGLKTWECSSDLAAYLADTDITNCVDKILEVGCGTAVPSLYLLHKIFHAKCHGKEAPERLKTTTVHLQDYNSIVLRLVTLPNIVLTWYTSPAAEPYRVAQSPPLPDTKVLEPGELSLTPELLVAFVESLKEYEIDLRFFSGTWADMDVWIRKRQYSYHLVLTSETIYRPSNLQSLTSLLRSSSTLREIRPEDNAHPPTNEHVLPSLRNSNPLIPCVCLVAAKVIYFGVGGGIDGFEKTVEETGGNVNTVYERKAGVSRRILQVTWTRNDSG